MQFDRAMSFLLEGQSIRRAAWIVPEDPSRLYYQISKRLDNFNGNIIFAGIDMVYSRRRPFIRRAFLAGEDLSADDWQIANDAMHDSDIASPTRTIREGEKL